MTAGEAKILQWNQTYIFKCRAVGWKMNEFDGSQKEKKEKKSKSSCFYRIVLLEITKFCYP
jgi:hypothetical protein